MGIFGCKLVRASAALQHLPEPNELLRLLSNSCSDEVRIVELIDDADSAMLPVMRSSPPLCASPLYWSFAIKSFARVHMFMCLSLCDGNRRVGYECGGNNRTAYKMILIASFVATRVLVALDL